MTDEQPELTGRQRLELALLEDDVETAVGTDDGAHTAALGALVRYILAEGITREQVYHPRESRTLTHSRFAVVLAAHPDDCQHECWGRDVLVAAGVIAPASEPAPDPDYL